MPSETVRFGLAALGWSHLDVEVGSPNHGGARMLAFSIGTFTDPTVEQRDETETDESVRPFGVRWQAGMLFLMGHVCRSERVWWVAGPGDSMILPANQRAVFECQPFDFAYRGVTNDQRLFAVVNDLWMWVTP